MINQNTESADVKRLMEQAQQGNVEAFEQLFQCYRDYMQRMVALRLDPRLRRRIDASDIVQEAHVVATQRIHDFLQREPISFRLWLRQIVQDQLLMAYRRHVRADRRTVNRELPLPEQSSLELAGQLAGRDPTPSQRVARAEQVRRVRVALGQLSSPHRDILLLRNYEQLSFAEIGYILHIKPSTARQRYGRALIRLGRKMRDMGLTESQI